MRTRYCDGVMVTVMGKKKSSHFFFESRWSLSTVLLLTLSDLTTSPKSSLSYIRTKKQQLEEANIGGEE